MALSWLAFLVLAPALLLHRKTRAGFLQRFGFYSAGTIPAGGWPRIWLHGASAGDLQALAPMMRRFRLKYPDCRILVSTITNTGFLMARERFAADLDAVLYAPWDLWGATRRATRALEPHLLVLEYTELWPNLIHAAHQAGARVVLTNGRFAPDRLGAYRALLALAGNPLRELDLLLMREDEEAERALSLGAPLERVWVTGNTKFDALGAATLSAQDGALRDALGLASGAPLLIAGSTHEGEEEVLLSVYRRLLALHPHLKLVLAPRYIDRAARVLGLAEAAGFTAARRTAGAGATRPAQVVVLDTIGELSQAYRLATLVFVGGSFTNRGGQNILEPAAQGKPVLFGPNMANFSDSVQVLLGRGGIQVPDAQHFETLAADLLGRPETCAQLGELAAQAVRQVSGASQRNVDLVARMLGASPRPPPGRPAA